MIDLQEIRKAGGTPEKLRAKFELPKESRSKGINHFVDLNISRIQEGVERNLSLSRTYYAVDQAFDAPQRQASQTLLEGIAEKNFSNEQLKNMIDGWGMKHLLSDAYDSDGNLMKGTDGMPIKGVSAPIFYKVLVPLVAAYVKIRWAKLFNERNLFPLYKYQPAQLTRTNRLRSEIITNRIQRMTQEMGYAATERQSILSMLLYSFCINFPQEPYYQEQQAREVDDGKGGKVTKNFIVKEGVRFVTPHPSRVYYDMAHPLTTINTDTGVEYAGYWNIMRYGEIASQDKVFWNLDSIGINPSKSKFANQNKTQLAYEMMYPCVAKFPWDSNGGMSSNSREGEAFRYSRSEWDKAVHVSTHFVKVIPKDWDLFDYSNPVWMRVVIAAESTVIFAEPIPYNPLVAYLYDHDGGRAQTSSLGLELIPFQDQMGNMFSQYILSVKKNLGRVVFYDRSQVGEGLVNQLRAGAHQAVTDHKYVPFDPSKRGYAQNSGSAPFHTAETGQVDTAEIAGSIVTMLNLMERMLGFSAQELGSSAPHEQSATEVSLSAQSSGVRTDFTSSFIDEAFHRKKELLYHAMLTYSSDRIFAEVSRGAGATADNIKELGFEVEDPEGDIETNMGVTGPKTALFIDSFSSNREGRNRVTDTKIAAMMIQNFQVIFSQPELVQAIGIDQVIQLLNYVLQFSGVPKDFRLEIDPEAGQQQAGGEIQQQIVQIAQAVQAQEQSAQQVSQGIMGEVEKMATQLGESIRKLSKDGENRDQAIGELQTAFDGLRNLSVL